MNAPLKVLSALPIALALSACSGGGSQNQAARGGGEVLQGSVNDDMLPYDTVRSQPPLAAPEASGAPGAGAGGGDEAAAQATDPGPGTPQVPDEAAPVVAPASPASGQ